MNDIIIEYALYLLGAAVITFIWFIITKIIKKNEEYLEKRIEEAKRLKHVCTAKLVNTKIIKDEDEQKDSLIGYYYICTYEYSYNNKVYKKKMFFDHNHHVLEKLTIYFIKNPRRVFMKNGNSSNNPFWINRFIIVSTIIIFTANIIKLFI